MYSGETFNPDNISRSDMALLAEHIEEYLDLLKEVMIIPDELYDKYNKRIQESIKRTEQLVKKLKKGDISVFKDDYE